MRKTKTQPQPSAELATSPHGVKVDTARLQSRLECLAAVIVPETIVPEKRTCEMVMYSGAPVTRVDWWTGEKYILTLSLDPAHVRLDRMNNGAPLLDSHYADSVETQLGVIESAKIDGGKLTGVARFSARDDVAPIWADVADGIIRNTSVGFNIHRLQDITPSEDKVKQYLATDWEPMECSVVSIPADPGAGFLSAQLGRIDLSGVLIDEKAGANTERGNAPLENVVDKDKNTLAAEQLSTTGSGTGAPPPVAIDTAKLKLDAAKDATAEERVRFTEIRKIGERMKLDAAFIDKHIADGTALDAFRVEAINQLAAADDAADVRNQRVTLGASERTKTADAMTGALLHRFRPDKYKLDDGMRQFRGMSLVRLAEASLESFGVKTRGMTPMEIAGKVLSFSGSGSFSGEPTLEKFGAMSTSDFPYILAAVANKSLREAYAAEMQTWRAFCRQANSSDFKAKYVNQLGDAPSLELVGENGEFKYGSIPEARESYSLKTYGKILPLTRQAIINDDMAAFTRIPELQGRAVSRLESDLVWQQITTNPTMGDTGALFNTTAVTTAGGHANLLSAGTVVSVDNIGISRAKMRLQKGLSNTENLNLVAKFIVGPTALEQVLLQYTGANFIPATAATQNVWAGLLTPVVEARLDANSATAWYLIADPSQIDTLEYAYLEGHEGAYYETRVGFNVDGLELKVRHDFGAKVIDWRAFVKNPGA